MQWKGKVLREGGRTVGSGRVTTIIEYSVKSWILWGFREIGKPFSFVSKCGIT